MKFESKKNAAPKSPHWTCGFLRDLPAFREAWLQAFSAPRQNPHRPSASNEAVSPHRVLCISDKRFCQTHEKS